MKSPKNEGKTSKIQSIVLIVLGFFLIFAILTSMILYTYYDRSLVDMIQGIGREEPKPEEPEPEPEPKPALLAESTANENFTNNLWIFSDACLGGVMDLTVSASQRHFATSFISTTNYMEALFSGIAFPEQSYTMVELLSTNTPKYLLINFSGTGLSLPKDATENLYRSIVDLILKTCPETTVILSGPIPVSKSSEISAQAVIDLDTTLADLCDSLHKSGKNVYYLASPASFFDTDKHLKTEYAEENGVLNPLGCEVYFNYVLRHPVPASKE